ncbi:MAG: prephenate dehydratase [Proteobacteria bacterium]|nr:prephenate dehydratase [Pseudomonadota bacterium]
MGVGRAEPRGAEGAEIAAQRAAIDRIDRRIVDLLNQRARCAQRIGGAKAAQGLPVPAPEREGQVLAAMATRNRGPLSPGALEGVFTEIIAACRAVQSPRRVAFLGPENTFSHQAAVQFFGPVGDFAPLGRIEDVFDQVARGECQAGVVPVENSIQGGVNLTLDLFLDHEVKICGEIFSPISHVLMAGDRARDAIEAVYSHPQALAQCRKWLAGNLPRARLVETTSTTAAVQEAARQPGRAAIGSLSAARGCGLEVLARDIQDNAPNLTRFWVIGRRDGPPTGADKTSVIFSLPHRPGALHRALGALAERGVNLTRIESRPIRERPWEYAFFVDFEGHAREEKIEAVLQKLGRRAVFLQVLGSYPMAGRPEPEGADSAETTGASHG